MDLMKSFTEAKLPTTFRRAPAPFVAPAIDTHAVAKARRMQIAARQFTRLQKQISRLVARALRHGEMSTTLARHNRVIPETRELTEKWLKSLGYEVENVGRRFTNCNCATHYEMRWACPAVGGA